MSEFKVGDKVRIARLVGYMPEESQGLIIGNTGTITNVYDGYDVAVYSVLTDNAEEPAPQGLDGWVFCENELELVA